ncbi:hypothetical protein PInf_027787 [Phytophthora infestans]|nr:hypothetical protein PInf_027787 [Phytophthora infestans]
MPGSYASDGDSGEAAFGETQMDFDDENTGAGGDVDLKSFLIDTGDDNNRMEDSGRHEEIDETNEPQSVDSEPEHYSWKRADGRERGQSLDEEDEEETRQQQRSQWQERRVDSSDTTHGYRRSPAVADEKNRELHAQIRIKEARYEAAKRELAETSSRVEIMTEHLKNRQLAEREIGRVAQEAKVLDAEAAELERKLAGLQGSNEAMDAFKLQMNWNQDEMEQWAVAARQKEEDAMALERYRRADEARIKELTLALEKLTQQLTRAKREVDDEATETQAKQMN